MNSTGLYIANPPAWWEPEQIPDKVARASAELLKRLDPATYADDPTTGLLLYGPPGTGKTSSAVAVALAWGKAGHTAAFQDFGELMISIRSSWRKDAGRTTEQIMAAARAPKILVLDDVGKRNTPEDQETLSVLFNSRINLNRPTICTTNCDLSTAEGRAQFDAACDSRVAERYRGREIQIKGTNLRAKP